MTSKDLALTTPAEKTVKAFFPAIQGDEIQRAVTLVNKGFDPGFHLMLYQNRVFVTIDGHQWWLRKHYPRARIVSKPMKGEDREDYGLADYEIGVIASVYMPRIAEPVATGFGRASKDPQRPVSRGSAVESTHPYRMAEKRAEAQVIRKVCPIGVDVSSPEEAVDTIIDAESRVVSEEGEQSHPLAHPVLPMNSRPR